MLSLVRIIIFAVSAITAKALPMGWIRNAYSWLRAFEHARSAFASLNKLCGSRCLGFEELESRKLLSAVGYAVQGEINPISPRDTNAFPITPNGIRGAYGLGSYTAGVLTGGINYAGVPGDGRGQTIAIVDAYDDPTGAERCQRLLYLLRAADVQ